VQGLRESVFYLLYCCPLWTITVEFLTFRAWSLGLSQACYCIQFTETLRVIGTCYSHGYCILIYSCGHLYVCLYSLAFYLINFASSQMSYWIMFLLWPAGHSLLTFMSALNSFHPNLHFTATSYSLLLIFSTFLAINSIHFLSPWYLHSSKTSAWLPIFILFSSQPSSVFKGLIAGECVRCVA